ncbi:MAG: FAD-dependent oxidoreductase, partial [Mesosutterella sp.]|nr:FAD-dependent oxidoreductase [Mesosutterella sp.]
MKKSLIASALALMMAVPAFAESTDIVVIGSGGAGLSSAIMATEAGAKVIVLEKMAYFGGNSNRSEGGMNAAATKLQIADGVTDDSPEIFYKDTMKGGHNLNNP